MAPPSSTSAAPLTFQRGLQTAREAELLLAGWALRGTAAGPRLDEMVHEYRRIGFDVELVPHRHKEGACHVCYEADALAEGAYRDVYVRRRPAAPATGAAD